jgi:hypothetical protein
MTTATRSKTSKTSNSSRMKIDAEGDVVLLCNRGRSRSPMYLVAYLVVMYNMKSCAAMKCVGKLLLEQRGEVLDRYGSLKPVIDLIAL